VADKQRGAVGWVFQSFSYHGGIIGQKLWIVQDPVNPTNPAHEKVIENENRGLWELSPPEFLKLILV
jgi:hypothetical protein